MRPFWQLEGWGANQAIYGGSSYLELASLCDQQLERARERELVLLLADNSPESLIAYLSCLRRRLPLLLFPAGLSEPLLQDLLESYRPGTVFSKGPIAGFPSAPGHWRQSAGDSVPVHPELALLLSTSGSTGSPKCVRLSYANIQSNAEQIAEYLSLDETERAITSLPFSYSYGLSVINSHLLVGASLALTDGSLMQKGFWELFREHRATSLAGVPYSYQLLERLDLGRLNLPTLKTLTQAGGRLPPDKVLKFARLSEQLGLRFFVMYGQTEASPRMAYLPPEHAIDKPDCIGLAVPGGELKLRDGELVYRGPNVMMGYATGWEDLERGDDLRGELATGDLGEQDRDGFFKVTGRVKRFLKVQGLRFNLDELEAQLEQVSRGPVACGGKDELLRVFVESTEVARVKDHLADALHISPILVSVKQLDQLPRLANGKIDYHRLGEL